MKNKKKRIYDQTNYKTNDGLCNWKYLWNGKTHKEIYEELNYDKEIKFWI